MWVGEGWKRAFYLPIVFCIVTSQNEFNFKMQYMASGGGDPTIVAQLDQLIAQAVSAHQFNDPMANAQMTGRAAGQDPLTLKASQFELQNRFSKTIFFSMFRHFSLQTQLFQILCNIFFIHIFFFKFCYHN